MPVTLGGIKGGPCHIKRNVTAWPHNIPLAKHFAHSILLVDMKLGIIGKPQSGKTTVFNAASGRQEAVGDFSQSAHRAVIKVPDERVIKLAELIKPQRVVHAEIEFLDVPGFTGKGKQSTGFDISPELRQTDALIVVVGDFSENSQPTRDIQDLIDEMILADQVVVETNIDKKSKKIKLTGDKSESRELELLKKTLEVLQQEKPLIDLDLSEDDVKLLRGYMFLTQKPLLIVVNIGENDLPNTEEIHGKYTHLVAPGKRELAVLSGKIEMELASLEKEEQKAFLDDLGITTPAVEQVIQKSYCLLGLISFITVEGPEVRAWPVKKGTVARKAAGVVHSDIERGFIRAEVTRYEEYIAYETPAALKAAGKARLEGKEYVVQDGDVITFRFNV